jgi:hypothetical protein
MDEAPWCVSALDGFIDSCNNMRITKMVQSMKLFQGQDNCVPTMDEDIKEVDREMFTIDLNG